MQFLKTSTKLSKVANNIKFLLNCRRCKLVPPCLNSKPQPKFNSSRSAKEFQNVAFKHNIRILSIMVADAKRSIVVVKSRKQALQRRLWTVLDEPDFKRVKEMVENKSLKTFTTTKTKQQRKLECLKSARVTQIHHETEWIENTTNTNIPDYLERTLMLGPNFNVHVPDSTPYVKLISEMESGIKLKENADDIRSEMTLAISNYINYHKQPRHRRDDWIIKDIRKSQKFLKDHPELIITRADKGSKTVILSSNEYDEKMMGLLSDTQTYKQLRSDPTSRITKSINNIVDSWLEHKYIDKREHRMLKVSSSNPSRIYGLPKIHKPNRPLRPVVSTIGSATYHLAKFLSNIITKILGKTDAHV